MHTKGKKPVFWKAMLLFSILAGLLLVATHINRVRPPENPHACRFWGIISDKTPKDIILKHLSTLRKFATSNNNGWGMAYYFNSEDSCVISRPLTLRGGSRADIDPDYESAMDEMAKHNPRAGIAHVRLATSGHCHVPNPHPFREKGILFAHNGTIDRNVLVSLITQKYLDEYPLDYREPYIDSELYFIYLLKVMEENPSMLIEQVIRKVVRTLYDSLTAVDYESKLNFVLTSGDNLWALRFATTNIDYYTVYYYPSSYTALPKTWAVASEPLSPESEWRLLDNYTLIVLKPGEPLLFVPILNDKGKK